MKKTLSEQIAGLEYCHRLLESTVAVRTALKDPTVPLIADYAESVTQALATLRALEPVVDEMREVIRRSRGQ